MHATRYTLLVAAFAAVLPLKAATAQDAYGVPGMVIGSPWGTIVVAPLRSPNVQTLPPMTAEQVERDAKWVDFCQPVKHVDEYGVTRLMYAHAGCEFGRTE